MAGGTDEAKDDIFNPAKIQVMRMTPGILPDSYIEKKNIKINKQQKERQGGILLWLKSDLREMV